MGKIIRSLEDALNNKEAEVEKLDAASIMTRLAVKNYIANNHKPKRATKKKKRRKK